MIGQKNNREMIDNWRLNRSIPRCILIKGEVGSGRYTLAQYIAKVLGVNITTVECSKDDVREVIELSYKLQQPACYVFRNIDVDMSESAKNALLKIIEEPPNKAYFIFTTKPQGTLETIESRCTIMHMEPYTLIELKHFSDDMQLLKFYHTPGKLIYWSEQNFDEFFTFCKNSINTILSGTGVQSLQIVNKLATKAGEDGYNPSEFIEIISILLIDELMLNKHQFLLLLSKESYCLQALDNKSLKKDSIVDTYILWLRDFIDYVKEENVE